MITRPWFCLQKLCFGQLSANIVNFFQFSSKLLQFSRKTDSLLESLCTDIHRTDLQGAETERDALEAKVSAMGKTRKHKLIIPPGQNFRKNLRTCDGRRGGVCRGPYRFREGIQKSRRGEKTKVFIFQRFQSSRDYAAGVAHVRDSMAAARIRRKRQIPVVETDFRWNLQVFGTCWCSAFKTSANNTVEHLWEGCKPSEWLSKSLSSLPYKFCLGDRLDWRASRDAEKGL